MIALIAPEIVLFAAMEQRWCARYFLRKIEKFHSQHSSHPEKVSDEIDPALSSSNISQVSVDESPKHKFDIEYAMYAVMGGFIVDVGSIHNKLKFATLTPDGILLLAKEGKFISAYPGSITAKSQMDFLSKIFVCCQALSFFGQIIERKVAGLIVSLLELNTAVHIGCTVVMYILWFHKPYNIEDPTLVSMDDHPEMLAFFVTSSRWPRNSGFEITQPKSLRDRLRVRFSGSADPPFAWFGSLTEIPAASDQTAIDIPQSLCDNNQDVGGSSRKSFSNNATDTDQRGSSEPDREALCQSDPCVTYFPVSTREHTLPLESGQVLPSGFGPIDDPDIEDLSHRRYRIELSQKDVYRLDLAAIYMRKLLES